MRNAVSTSSTHKFAKRASPSNEWDPEPRGKSASKMRRLGSCDLGAGVSSGNGMLLLIEIPYAE
jgi:hypothetical protein